jgi:Kef-type K+ transport system membrane component KefB
MRFTPITSLLIGAALLLLGKRLAQRRRINGTVGFSLSLCMVALALALIPNGWQEWLAGGEAGDRALTFARELGLTGLFFLAGTRFDANEIWKARRISLFVSATVALLVALIATLLMVSWGSDRGALIVAAAVISGTSLWLPGQLGLVSEKGTIAAAPGKSAAAALTVLSLLAVYLYSALHGLAARRLSASAYAVVILYELVKVAVVLSLAYFVATRFLTRAEDRASPAHIVIGYLLMATLIFTMARLVIGPLGGAAWSFIAGAVLVWKGPGSKLTAASHPVTSVAVAVLSSFAFLPLLLQSHGRSLHDKTLVFSLVGAALVCKFAAVWAGARLSGAAGLEARRIAASTLAAGEVGILLLGFSVTRLAIDGQFYFGILTFAFISTLLGNVIWRFFAGELVDSGRDDEAQPKSDRWSRLGAMA